MTIYLGNVLGHTPGESWSLGLHFDGGISVDIAAATTAFHDAANLLFSTNGPGGHSLLFYISTTVGVDDVTVASIDDATNKQITKNLATLTLVGTDATATLPPQTALAVSLRTALATRGGRGRFYLPPLCTNASTGGRVLTDARDTALAGATAMLDHLTAALCQPIVWHKAQHLGDPITRVDVGDVFDTQRRRRNKLVEARNSHSF